MCIERRGKHRSAIAGNLSYLFIVSQVVCLQVEDSARIPARVEQRWVICTDSCPLQTSVRMLFGLHTTFT